MKYVFPLQSDVEVSKEDVLNLIDKHWVESLSGTQRTTVDWFLQYVNDVDEGNAGTHLGPCIVEICSHHSIYFSYTLLIISLTTAH